MKVVMYSQEGCPSCRSIREYLEKQYGAVEMRSADDIRDIPDKLERAGVYADLQLQNEEVPLVYIDGVWQPLAELMKKVKTISVSRNDAGERCAAEFIFR